MTDLYFIVRTDVTGDSGQQRVFGCYDKEEDAAAYAMQIAAHMYGEFEVVPAGASTMKIVREGGIQAVRVEPTTPSE